MSEALAAYRDIVCKARGHKHGRKGELDCLLSEYAKHKAAASPSKPSRTPKVGITFYLDRQVAANLDQLASGEKRSRANLITLLIQEALEARGVGA